MDKFTMRPYILTRYEQGNTPDNAQAVITAATAMNYLRNQLVRPMLEEWRELLQEREQERDEVNRRFVRLDDEGAPDRVLDEVLEELNDREALLSEADNMLESLEAFLDESELCVNNLLAISKTLIETMK